MDSDKIRELILLRIKTLEEPPRSARKDFAIEELQFIFNRIPDATPPARVSVKAVEEIKALVVAAFSDPRLAKSNLNAAAHKLNDLIAALNKDETGGAA